MEKRCFDSLNFIKIYVIKRTHPVTKGLIKNFKRKYAFTKKKYLCELYSKA